MKRSEIKMDSQGQCVNTIQAVKQYFMAQIVIIKILFPLAIALHKPWLPI